MVTKYDELEIYCRMLGHPLKFSYCRATGGNTPCRKIADCWYQRIAIREFLAENFPPETIQRMTAPPKDKVVSIIELIEQAEKTKSGDS